jgi:predicted MFS family arabinose efflux permease
MTRMTGAVTAEPVTAEPVTAEPVTAEPVTAEAVTAEPVARKPFGWRFTAPLLLGSTLNPINSSMIATGLVGIGVDFHTGPGTTASLISVLYLCSSVMQPTMGKLSTLFGPRRIFLAGVIILLIAGAIGAAAPTFGFLLLSRALIGVGTSAAYPTAMALVRKRADSVGIGVPSRVLGNFSIASQITAVFGLPLGGVLTGTLGWRALFAVNIPLAIITLAFTLVGVAKDNPIPRQGRERLLTALDIPGIVLFAGTITSLLLFLSSLKAPTWWLLPVIVILAAALLSWERRASRPLIDVRMLGKNRPLQRTYLRQMLVALGIYASLYGTSQWMEQSAHLSASAVGLILLPLSGLSIIIARVVSGRGWVRWPLILAGVALILTAGVMLLITRQSGVLVLIGMSLLLGFTNGFSSFANQAALYVQAPAEEMAVASGLYRTFAYIGAIFSASLIGITYRSAATDGGLHALAWVLGGIGVAVVLLAVLDKSIPQVAK